MTADVTEVDGADEHVLVGRLSLDDKVRLLTGADNWTLHGHDAIGLRPIVCSDGPAGVRGVSLDPDNPSSSLPCPVALAATWDEALVTDVAAALGAEARGKGVHVLLAPTVNIVRTPLGGRGFECFSEDPVLTARMAAAFVTGVQRHGVAATVKHYVGNDSETERWTYDARIAEHVLREVYLAPFETSVAESAVWLVMAAYSGVNGVTMTENASLLREVLKEEWGFDGVVVSDWTAARDTNGAALGGLDLVMPGPDGPWGDRLVAAVRSGEVPEATVDDKLVRLLRLARRVGVLGDGTGTEPPSRQLIDHDLLRRATARTFVLLRNQPVEDGRPLLPLDAGSLDSVALLGPNAVAPVTQGGGSVQVLAAVTSTPADALRAVLPGRAALRTLPGCDTWLMVPMPVPDELFDPVTDATGVRVELSDRNGTPLHEELRDKPTYTWWEPLPDHVSGDDISNVRVRTRYRAHVTGPHLFGIAGVGALRLLVGGETVLERQTPIPSDPVTAMSHPQEWRATVDLISGQDVLVELECRAADWRFGFVNVRLGVVPAPDEERLLASAVDAARRSDVAVVIVGSPEGSETEGHDRETLALAGRQNELVRRVAAVNPRTVVVVNSGMPVLMPWVDDVAAVLQVWLPGQHMGEALADVLTGAAEPGGRLPVTFPRAENDCPVLHATPVNGELHYDDGLLVGYRSYDRRDIEPLFGFGHGLGYTTWEYGTPVPSTTTLVGGADLEVAVEVRNTGDREGSEVVQVYLDAADPADPRRPRRVLAGFATVTAPPGGSAEAVVRVPARLFAHYDTDRGGWYWPAGRRLVHAGRSSRDLRSSAEITIA